MEKHWVLGNYEQAVLREIKIEYYNYELILVANSDAGKLNARNVFYCYVNVSVMLIINDDSVGDLICK